MRFLKVLALVILLGLTSVQANTLDWSTVTQAVHKFNPTWVTFVLCGALLCVSTRNQLAKQRRYQKHPVSSDSKQP